MQQSPMTPYNQNSMQVPPQGANAVSINIYSPQAFAQGANCTTSPAQNPQYYSMYGQNTNPNLPLYPANYNNMFNNQPNIPYQNSNALKANEQPNLLEKTSNSNEASKADEANKTDKKDDEAKKIVPLTDDYIKTLEKYLNDANPKVRLIGANDLMERFKEDENRKDNPSLIPLLNKILKDPSVTIRFVGLLIMQLGYSVGNEETIQILKQLQQANKDKTGEEQLMISKILLQLAAPEAKEVTQGS